MCEGITRAQVTAENAQNSKKSGRVAVETVTEILKPLSRRGVSAGGTKSGDDHHTPEVVGR